MPQVINDSKTMQLVSKWKFVEPEVCTWMREYWLSKYVTSCKNKYDSNFKEVSKIGFVYCPFCGKPIKDIPYSG